MPCSRTVAPSERRIIEAATLPQCHDTAFMQENSGPLPGHSGLSSEEQSRLRIR
jgi:hypothetical protein